MTGEVRESFASELAALRLRAGLSLAELGAAAHLARGYIHHIEHRRRWPSRSVVAALDSSLNSGGSLLALWEAVDNTVPPDRTAAAAPTTGSQRAGDADPVLVSAAAESARFLAWAETSNIGDLTLEQMHSEVRWIACNYLKVPTLPLFARTRTIRDEAFRLLVGRQRPDQTRDLYTVAGWALTMLAWISTDLGWPDAADTHARAAWVCADNADHHGLRAWVRATQHTAAFWKSRFLDAARYAEDGLRYAATGSAEAFLSSAWALDLAKAGQVSDACTALARARDVTEVVEQRYDDLAGPFTCSADRAGGFWSDVYLALGQPVNALTEADYAVAAFELVPVEQRNFGSERMARVQQVRAHLALSQLDGAYEALAPVLDTSPEYRVRPLVQRLGEVHTQAATCKQRNEPTLGAVRNAIMAFREQSSVAGSIG